MMPSTTHLVLIPSYNPGGPRLAATVAGALAHWSPVWVVDDGSTDETRTFLENWKKKGRHALFQKNQGQGVARNHALKQIQAELVLFIGDDIYASPDFLKQHLDFHKKNPARNRACLGLSEWDPNHTITPFMDWMTHGGYDSLRAHESTDFWHFYTSNLSLKTELLKKHKFNTAFHGYGWEDIELAYRLEQEEKLELVYIPKALAFHDHFLDEKDLERKMHSLAKNGKIFESLQPKVQILPKGLKRLIFSLLGSTLVVGTLSLFRKSGLKKAQRAYWYALSKRYFLQGLALLN